MINAKEYWKQEIEDYLERLNDDVNYDIKLDDNELERIVNQLLADDELWQVIEETMDYYIYHNK